MDRLVDGRGVVDGLVDRLGVVALGLRVVALAVDLMDLSVVGVLDIHDNTRVGIVNLVGHGLEATVGEGNMVLAVGGVAIPGLISAELDLVLVAVIGINTILVLVVGRGVLWLFVRGRVVGGLMFGGMVGGGMDVCGQGDSQEGGKGDEDLETAETLSLVYINSHNFKVVYRFKTECKEKN